MGYTTDEIQTAVQKVVLNTIRRSYDSLGARRTSLEFSDIQQAVAGAFILYNTSPFYCVALGAKRTIDNVNEEMKALEKLQEAVSVLGIDARPITDLSTLFNAKAALEALEGAVSSSAPKDITKLPQYQRFNTNVGNFLSTSATSVKATSGGMTPQQARVLIPSLLRTLQSAHAELQRRVGLLANAITDYNGVNLPSIVAGGIIQKSRSVLSGHLDELNGLSAEDRLLKIREVVLDLLTAKSAVKKFGSFSPPSPFYDITGVGTPYSDAAHPATPATLIGENEPGYLITDSNDDLTFTLDAAATVVNTTLPHSTFAQIQGVTPENPSAVGPDGYRISDGTTHPVTEDGTIPEANNHFKLKIYNRGLNTTTNVDVVLTSSSDGPKGAVTGSVDLTTLAYPGALNGLVFTFTIDATTFSRTFDATYTSMLDVVSRLNLLVSGYGTVTLNGSNHMVITSGSSGGGGTVVIAGGAANAVLGFTISQTGTGSFVQLRTAEQIASEISSGLPSGIIAEAAFPSIHFQGTVNVSGASGANATFTIPGSNITGVYIPQLVYSGDFSAVVVGDYLNVASGPNAGIWLVTSVDGLTPSVSLTAAKYLGLATNATGVSLEAGPRYRIVRVRVTSPTLLGQQVSLTLVGDTTASKNLGSTLGFVPGIQSSCRLTYAREVAASINKQTTKVVASVPFLASFAPVRAVTDPINPAHVILQKYKGTGDITYTAGSPNQISVVVSAGGLLAAGIAIGDVVVLRGGTPINTSWTITTATDVSFVAESTDTAVSSSGAAIEIGPGISVGEWAVVDVAAGPNKGRYVVDGQGTPTPLDILLKDLLVTANDPLTLSALEMSVTLATETLAFTSADTTTGSAVHISGAGAVLFSSVLDVTGTTPWFKLPSGSPSPVVGDQLELYSVSYNAPSSEHPIRSVSGGLIGVSPDVPSVGDWNMGEIPVPFARVRVGHMLDFGTFQGRLNAWLALSINQPTYFSDLNRFINPLLVNVNPTVEQLGSAQNQLLLLQHYLTLSGSLSTTTSKTIEYALQNLSVSAVGAIDSLIKAYKEKGSERALDLLLEGQFQTFFGLDAEQSSYAGAMQASVRDVMRQDLPVRKTARKDALNARQRASATSPDFEFNRSDIESAGKPETPT